MSEASSKPPTIISLVGPTAVGKTALSLAVAEALETEIISVDSRQVYRGMDIGTAKPSLSDRQRVEHHLVDVAAPDEEYSVAIYKRHVAKVIARLHQGGKLPLLVGGSGLYFRAVCDGLEIPPVPPQPELRAALASRVAAGDLVGIVNELRSLDPESAEKIDLANPRRVIRALEVTRVSGRPFSSWQERNQPNFQTIWIGLTRPRRELDARINLRVLDQIKAGIVNEVRNLVKKGYDYDLPAMQSIGYREIGWYLQGSSTLEEAVTRQQRATRRYARRQLTWFRPDTRIKWLPADCSVSDFLSVVKTAISNSSSGRNC